MVLALFYLRQFRLHFHWLLTTILPHHAPPAGSGRTQTLPSLLLPDTDRRIGEDRTRPDLEEHALYISIFFLLLLSFAWAVVGSAECSV